MEYRIKQWLVVLVTVSFVGCSPAPSFIDEDFGTLVKEIVTHDKERVQRLEEQKGKGINLLDVKKAGQAYTVSAELESALIPVVVQRIFDESGVPYMLNGVTLYGKITARFENLPLVDALNHILKPAQLAAQRDNDVVMIDVALTPIGSSDSSSVYTEVSVRNLDTSAVYDLLDGLYPPNIDDERPINFGVLSASNTVYVKGPKEGVTEAVHLITKADRGIPHVALEVLVVEFNSGDLERLGSRVYDATDGEYTLSFGYGDEGGVFNGSYESQDYGGAVDDLADFKVNSLRAMVEIMISEEKARLISRPYVATLSGTEASINIVSDRYIVVDSTTGEASTDPVTSGVVLRITPTVLPDRRIRMKVYVEDSQFSDVNVANIATEVNKNAAENLTIVEDQQTIRIGGLMLNRWAWGNTGFPFLRHVPLLNMVLSERVGIREEKEVFIFITPQIWEPSWQNPMIAPDAMTIKDKSGIRK